MDDLERREAYLSAATTAMDGMFRIPPPTDSPYLYVALRPSVPDTTFRIWATTGNNLADSLQAIADAARTSPINGAGVNIVGYRWERRGIGWRMGPALRPEPENIADLEVRPTGEGRLFCGAVGHAQPGDPLQVYENTIAGLTQQAFAALGRLYQEAGYTGPIDVGVAVTGLEGRIVLSGSAPNAFAALQRVPFFENYRDTETVEAAELAARPRPIARRLLMPLLQATAQGYDPFG